MRADPKNTTVSRIFSPAEMRQRLQIFGEDAQRPRVRAVQETLVQIGHRAAVAVRVLSCRHFFSSSSTFFFNSRTVFSNSGSF